MKFLILLSESFRRFHSITWDPLCLQPQTDQKKEETYLPLHKLIPVVVGKWPRKSLEKQTYETHFLSLLIVNLNKLEKLKMINKMHLQFYDDEVSCPFQPPGVTSTALMKNLSHIHGLFWGLHN